MNDQLDKLESSVARLVQAYNAMKAENAALKAQLSEKTAAVELLEEEAAAVRSRIDSSSSTAAVLLEEEAAAVRSRIDSLIASLTADQTSEQPSA